MDPLRDRGWRHYVLADSRTFGPFDLNSGRPAGSRGAPPEAQRL